MFASKAQVKTKIDGIDSIIGHDTEINGPMRFRGGIKVTGTVKGEVFGQTGSKGENSVLVDPSGKILGDVTADNVIIGGTVTGNVYAKSVCILKSARIEGSITFELIQIEAGAQLKGQLTCTILNNNNEQPSLEAA